MCVRLSHEFLVLNSQHLARQHRVPVVHERQIAAVVATEVCQVVAEGLPFGKVLLEGTEARIHRVPARVDEGGAWKDGVNQADVAEIIGQLVGEVCASRPQWRSLFEVAAAERAELR